MTSGEFLNPSELGFFIWRKGIKDKSLQLILQSCLKGSNEIAYVSSLNYKKLYNVGTIILIITIFF